MDGENIQFDPPASAPVNPSVSVPSNEPVNNIQPPVQAPMPEQKIGKFKASRLIVGESWKLLRQDKEMMLFPILSSIFSFIVIAIVGIFFFLITLNGNWAEIENLKDSSYGVELIFAFIIYFLTFFITIFFQTGIITIVRGRLNNQNLTFGDGMKNAFDKSGKILKWALVAATVGIILKMISDRSQILGKIVVALLGAAWGILTFFIAPILIVEELSIKESLKKSAAIIRKVWGEAVIIDVGVGFFFGMLFLIGLIIFMLTIFTLNGVVIITAGVLLLIYLVILCIISSTLSVIFKIVLYEYANTGQVPAGFSKEVIGMAFKQSKKKAGILGIGEI